MNTFKKLHSWTYTWAGFCQEIYFSMTGQIRIVQRLIFFLIVSFLFILQKTWCFSNITVYYFFFSLHKVVVIEHFSMDMQSCCAIPTVAWYVTGFNSSNYLFNVWKQCLTVPRLLPFIDIGRTIRVKDAFYPWFMEILEKG